MHTLHAYVRPAAASAAGAWEIRVESLEVRVKMTEKEYRTISETPA